MHTKVIMGSLRLDLPLEQVLVYVLDVVALGQQVALRHPHVAYDVLGGQRKDFVVIALYNRVFMAVTNQFF